MFRIALSVPMSVNEDACPMIIFMSKLSLSFPTIHEWYLHDLDLSRGMFDVKCPSWNNENRGDHCIIISNTMALRDISD
jgi:hypothetical protein